MTISGHAGARFSAAQQSAIAGLLGDQARLEATAADAFMDLLVT